MKNLHVSAFKPTINLEWNLWLLKSSITDLNRICFPEKPYNSMKLPTNFAFYCYRFYDLEKWEAKQRKKGRLKALKKAQKQQVSIESDELRHKSLHSGPTRPGKGWWTLGSCKMDTETWDFFSSFLWLQFNC